MSQGHPWMKQVALVLLAATFAAAPRFCTAADDPPVRAQDSGAAMSGLYLKVRLSKTLRLSKLKAGDLVEGTLARDVYSADRKLFPSGSIVRLTVDHIDKRKRIPNDHWPWVVRAFTPRHENYPVFKSATLAREQGERSLRVSLISVSRRREVYARGKNKSARPPGTENGAAEVSQSNKRPTTPTLVLEAFGIANPPSAADDVNEAAAAERDSAIPETLPSWTHCKILLLGDVSASKSKPGEVVHARLLEPVLLNSDVVLPAGTLFEGKVVKRTPPRWLSRAGSLYLTFTERTLPDGTRFPIAASLAGAELDARSHTRMDAEGQLHGERPGKAWMAINVGVTAGISKEVDDGIQLVIEALVSTATDVSTAGTARIVSSCVSGVYMATRHGRDVVLPRFTEMDISLDRPLSLNAAAEIQSPDAAVGLRSTR